jgi:hypothetical protein
MRDISLIAFADFYSLTIGDIQLLQNRNSLALEKLSAFRRAVEFDNALPPPLVRDIIFSRHDRYHWFTKDRSTSIDRIFVLTDTSKMTSVYTCSVSGCDNYVGLDHEIAEWVYNSLSGSWMVRDNFIFFSNENDLTLFKLKFGGTYFGTVGN